jgi:hypothetical protein
MNWWVPLAFVGAGLAGVLIAWSLTAGRPRSDAAAQPVHGHDAPRKSRYRQDNDLVWNPGAFLTVLLLVGVLVLIAVLIEVA